MKADSKISEINTDSYMSMSGTNSLLAIIAELTRHSNANIADISTKNSEKSTKKDI